MNGLSVFSIYFTHISLFKKTFFLAKDSSSNSLQNLDIFTILNNPHYFVKCDSIDWSEMHRFQKQHFLEFLATHYFDSLIIVALNVILFKKQSTPQNAARDALQPTN